MAEDALYAAIAHFQAETGRVMVTHAEIERAREAGWDKIPHRVLMQAISRAVETKPAEKRFKLRLDWIVPDVAETVAAWRRAVGPEFTRKTITVEALSDETVR